jgi:uncharacterized protein (DUF1800 family)
MKAWFLSAVVAALTLQASTAATPAANVPNDERAIGHTLNRLAFGPTPDDRQRVKRVGLGAWIEQQLQPQKTQNPQKTQKPQKPQKPQKSQKSQKTQKTQNEMEMAPDTVTTNPVSRGRQVFSDLAEAKLLRAVYSERQLEEVLVDFWFNHFNVFGRKGRTEIYITEYERDVIRPHVLGNFRELVGATAKSPAMLVYLDNWMSADPNAAAARPRPQARSQGRQRGLNENYARELLELHTLGVDGGYTQQDVVDVARALTGWTIGLPTQAVGFRFAPALHDRGEKRVLGHTIRAGGGIDDGERVLDIVSAHPSTAKHIAYKLAQRFVSDTPPPALVERAATRFRETKGDLREIVRTIVTSPEFFAPEAYRAKVKTPFEFVASALRATDAEVFSGMGVTRVLVEMGMPPYLCQPPTGYDETSEAWVSSGALVNRMNFAVQLASNRLRGVRVPAEKTQLARTTGDPDFQKQ